jgi:hypothetical protein
MTKKFNYLYESILGDLVAGATLTPVGPITISQEPVEDEYEEEEDLDDEITETEIASKIIEHVKKLRKQIGEDAYYRARQIQELAEKLLEMHPEIEVLKSVKEAVDSLTVLSTAERHKINNAFHTSDVLKGIQKVRKPSEGISVISNILGKLGYTLDMVSGDMLLGDKNTRHLPFRKKWDGEDPFNEHPQIENSRINFTWENLENRRHTPSIEIIAYAS